MPPVIPNTPETGAERSQVQAQPGHTSETYFKIQGKKKLSSRLFGIYKAICSIFSTAKIKIIIDGLRARL